MKSERKARTVSLPSFFKALIIDFIFTPLLLRLTARAYHFEEPFSTTDRDSAESSAHDPAAAASPKTSASASAHTRALTQPRPSQNLSSLTRFLSPMGKRLSAQLPSRAGGECDSIQSVCYKNRKLDFEEAWWKKVVVNVPQIKDERY